MISMESLRKRFNQHDNGTQYRSFWQCIHIDIPLLFSIMVLMSLGFVILYSASNQDIHVVEQQALHMGVAMLGMFVMAQIPPSTYRRWAPWLYVIGVVLLVTVLVMGHISKGGQRWLNLGIIRLQPSEILKIGIPMTLAWYYHRIHLPITLPVLVVSGILILIPAVLTAKQPDLGTAILMVVAGASTIFLAGMSWWLIISLGVFISATAPVLWYVMHDYQKQRVLTFFNPERDPLGAGYHIIQSKIAIGSGGLFGKGWLSGTQSHLHFLPEHSTDFIFAAWGEEFGFMGSLLLIVFFMIVVLRCLVITINAQDTFSRLVAGSLTLTFFVSFFVNMGMVTGILPVVGVPLPLISYGGSSMVTLMASFGILMSIQTHRKLLTS